jgi:uncharacterized protein
MTILSFSLLLALGAAVGFAAGLLGIGGGMMIVPFLTILLEANGFAADDAIKIAIATSLATVVFTSMSSVRAHHSHRAVLWRVAAMLTPGIVVGALAAAHFAAMLRGATLAALFAAFVGFSATQMLIDRKPRPTRQLPGAIGMSAAGATIGALSSLVGAGGAFVSVPFMTWCNVRAQHAVGTSSALGFPIAFAGTIGYMTVASPAPAPTGMAGLVYLPAMLALSLASVTTAPLGARLAHALPTRRLKQVFAIQLYALGAYMLYRAIAG